MKKWTTFSRPMHIFRLLSPQGPRLALGIEGARYDLSTPAGEFADVSTWLSLPDPVAAVHNALERSRNFQITEELLLLPPLDVQEVWACGVTYWRSKVARMEESKVGGDFYDQVYHAERPEISVTAQRSLAAKPQTNRCDERRKTWRLICFAN